MVWRYEAIDSLSRARFGIFSGSRKNLLIYLQQEQLLPVSFEVDGFLSIQRLLRRGMASSADLSVFFKDLSGMIKAGLSLTHIIRTFEQSLPCLSIRSVCGRMHDDLSTGMSLAEAMEKAGVFPRMALYAVRSGERSGQLVVACALLSEYYQTTSELKGRLLCALGYPAVVFIFLCTALIYITQKVVPALTAFLPPQAMEGALSHFVMITCRFFVDYALVLLLSLISSAILLAVVLVHFKEQADAFFDRLPVIGLMRREVDIAFVFFDIFILLKSGITLDSALHEVATSGHSPARVKMKACEASLVVGHTFSEALEESAYFPPLVIDTVKIAEETGAYADYCERLYRIYYRFFETRLVNLAGMVSPVLLGFCAMGIIIFAVAFLKPVYANLTHIGVM